MKRVRIRRRVLATLIVPVVLAGGALAPIAGAKEARCPNGLQPALGVRCPPPSLPPAPGALPTTPRV